MTKNNKERVFGRTEIHKHKLEKSRDKKEYSTYIPTFLRMGLVAVVCFMILFAGICVASASNVTTNENGQIFVDGEPFFPIGVSLHLWFDQPRTEEYLSGLFEDFNAAGINTVRDCYSAVYDGSPTSFTTISYNVASTYNIKIIYSTRNTPYSAEAKPISSYEEAVNTYKNHSAAFAWEVFDEPFPENVPFCEEVSSLIKSWDSDHLCYVNFALHSAGYHPDGSETWLDYATSDKYPVGLNYPTEPRDYYIEQVIPFFLGVYDAWEGKMPTGFWVQGRAKNGVYPTYEEERYMTYAVIANNATGIYWFCYDRAIGEPGLWESIKQVAGELNYLHDALAQGYPTESVSVAADGEVLTRFHKIGNKGYLIAVNNEKRSLDVTFTSPYYIHTAKTLFESVPTKNVNGTSFTDTFGRLGVHVYELTLEGEVVGTISGTVTNTTGALIEGVNVQAGSYSSTTNSTGGYSITNVSVGNYTVTASAIGYQRQSRENVEVLEDQTTEVNFTLTEGTDLVAEWHFDEGSGIIAEDTSGNNNHGTLTNMDPATDWVDGKPGKALDFDGSNDYVDCGNVLNFERTDSFSIMAWVKTTDAVGNIVGNSHSSSPYRGYSLLIDGSQLRVHLINDYVAGNRIQVNEATSGTVNDGNWHHVGMTYTGSNSAAGIKLFIDGQEIGTTTVTDNLSATIISPVSLTIGKKPDGDHEYPLDGTIDEVRIYNRALNAEEIKADYEAVLEDITLPETTITSGPDRTINNSVISFSWTGSDDVTLTSQLLYSYKLEGYGDSWSSWTSVTTKSFNGLANYDYTFKVKAKDEAGNEDPTPAERPFLVDIPVTVPRYDVNADGKVDVLDITIVAQHYGETTNPPYPRYDVNVNGKVNVLDIKIVEQHFGEITN